MEIFIVAGLGNPGLAYRNSRHNAGFWAADELARELNVKLSKRGMRAAIGEGVYNSRRVILVKPETYMNLSGEAVSAIMRYYKARPENLIVIYDDIDLPTGALRIRAGGSAGTHNGMRSVIACLNGEENFPRVRVGIGREYNGRELKGHVLGKPGKEERKLLDDACGKAAKAAMLIIEGKLMDAQAMYNKKSEQAVKE